MMARTRTTTAESSTSHNSHLDHSNAPSSSVNDDQHQSTQHISRNETGVNVSHQVPAEGNDNSPSPESVPFKPNRRFWLVLASMASISLCGSIEGTIVINAMPTIVAALGGGDLFIWVPNAFYLASIAALPLVAQISDIFGRRRMMLGATSLFVLGCALGGASTSMTMLIAARTIQGLGSGAIDVLFETIILDLVPLRERSKYLSFMSIGTMVGFAVGPFLGGLIVVKLGWPWIFYLNVILGGFSLVMFFFCLRLKRPRGQNFWSNFKRIDFGGNAILIGAVVAVLIALTWAGPVYHWDSARIVAPLVVGLLGLLAFTAFEWTPRLAPEPSFPRAIVSNRTSAAALAMTIVNSMTYTGFFYFLPVYFQGVLAKSPLASGIALAPAVSTLIPFAAVSGILLSKVGKYRPIHIFGWSALLVAVGLCSTLNRHSSAAAWACFEILGVAGIGALVATLLSALQSPLPEKYVATSAGMYNFGRGFGAIWGITLPSVIFNNVVKQQVKIDASSFPSNSTLPERLAEGQAYQFATKAFLDSLPPDNMMRDRVISIFERAVQTVFYSLTAFAAFGLLLVLLEKEIPMRTENKTEFGLEESANERNEARSGDGGERVEDAISFAREPRSRIDDAAKSGTANEIELEGIAGPSR